MKMLKWSFRGADRRPWFVLLFGSFLRTRSCWLLVLLFGSFLWMAYSRPAQDFQKGILLFR